MTLISVGVPTANGYFTEPAAIMSLLASLTTVPRLGPVMANLEKGNAEVARLNAEKKRLLSLSVRGLFDDAQVEAESIRIDSEIQRWTVFLRQADRGREAVSVSNAKSVAALPASAFAEFEFLSVKDRKKLLRPFLARVYVRDGAIVKLAMRVPSSGTNLGIRTGADAQFGALREVELTLSKPYTKNYPASVTG
jgi:hypothetical protein